MGFNKYGSDPSGSDVRKLEAKEARDQIQSIKYGEAGEQDEVLEEKETPNLFEEKEPTPDQEAEDSNQEEDSTEE